MRFTGLSCSLLLSAALLGGPVAAQTPPPPRALILNPVQAAFLQAETKRIEDAFVQKVMAIAGVSREQVLRAIPAKGRLTDRLARIYSSLERDLGAPLADEQKGRIFIAEEERKQALRDLPAIAASK